MQGAMPWESYIRLYISYRRWLVNRIIEDLEAQKQATQNAQGTPQMVSNGKSTRSTKGPIQFG